MSTSTSSNGGIATPSTTYSFTTAIPSTDHPITLQVGERRFTTILSTLTNASPFLATHLTDHVHNGAFFIDADGGLFTHILGYLRSGILPVLRKGHGFDEVKYTQLLSEARRFGIEPLVGWIENMKYSRPAPLRIAPCGMDGVGEGVNETKQKQKRVYVCPRGIKVHKGGMGMNGFRASELCGKECELVKKQKANVLQKGSVLEAGVPVPVAGKGGVREAANEQRKVWSKTYFRQMKMSDSDSEC